MNSVQTNSLKIQKKCRNTKEGDRNYSCGGCNKAYKSYPALYLHIKRKHQGVKPDGCQTHKALVLAPEERMPTGRPQKPVCDIDSLCGANPSLETTENDFFGFIGDYLEAICPLSVKPTLQEVVLKVDSVCKETKDEYLCKLSEKVQELYTQMVHEVPAGQDIQLEYETVKDKGPKETIMILAWFVLWLGRDIVKSNFIPDICLIFSKIWKILSQVNGQVKDLDTKQIWSKIYIECEQIMSNLVYMKGKEYLLPDLVKKLCQFIGKTFA